MPKLTRKQLEAVKELLSSRKVSWFTIADVCETAIELMDECERLLKAQISASIKFNKLLEVTQDVLKHPIWIAHGANARNKIRKLIEKDS